MSAATIELKEDPAKIRIAATSLGDLLLNANDRYPDKVALIFGDQKTTYAELTAAVMQRARSLMALGVKPRDHVGILLPTGLQFVETFFAAVICGAVAVLMNARYRASELNYIVENADLKILLTTDAIAEQVNFVERLNEAFPDLAKQTNASRLALGAAPKLEKLVLLGKARPAGFVGQQEFDAAAEPVSEREVHLRRIQVRLRDTGLILYTSGTSANPKGCLLSHEAMARNSMVLGRHRWHYGPDDIVWSPLPLFHIAALLPLLSIIDAGGAYVGQAFFDPGEALKQIEENRATAVFAPFVTFLQGLQFHPDFTKRDLTSVRIMNSCFAMMPPSVAEGFRKVMPKTLQVGTFGMSEAAGIVSTGGEDMDVELGFTRLGYPLSGLKVRIIDRETGADLPTGQQGEVLIWGFSLFDAYYRDPEKTAEAIDAEGWYHSGDIGSVDENGHLMFHGRLKDMLKVGGENVAAAEVEAVLQQHEAVKLAQVVGLPDPRLDEIVAAFVELKPGASATEAELIDFCKRRIASFKAPRYIRFLTEWPMSASKIQKFKMRQELMKELGLG